MQAIEFKGFWGLLALLLIALLAVAFIVLVPSVLATVAWNALIFETFKGPEIDLLQGGLLWLALMLALYSVLQPEVVFEMHTNTEPELPPAKTKPTPKNKPDSESVSTHWQQWRNRMNDDK
jgi:hypothetical protein